MNRESTPYVVSCNFCEQGLLRLMRCGLCEHIAAVCDECELAWENVQQVSVDSASASSSSYPVCPSCGESTSEWSKMDMDGIRDAGLSEFVGGTSE